MKSTPFLQLFIVVALGINGAGAFCAEGPATTGPATEKRFPPLTLPVGFHATLFACDPLIEYPSALSVGSRPGEVFVAVDYMTGLGTEIVRRSEVRRIEDTDGDGYADKATLYAGEFNSIMGLAYHDGTLFVMHAPYLTSLRDTKGAGVADERTDIVVGLGLAPEENPVRLHCANGVTVGHDGWLYLALGDHGCDVKRREGDRLVLEGGGILRCRPDGRDLHIFATGLRNIYDVALDDQLNVFVRDNENDGGDYKIRVCHSFFGADHGYPYLYYERPREALPPLADLGLGSSAGGVCYLERHFPAEYQGNIFVCEWGKSLVRYPLRRQGSGFASPDEIEFAVGADNDPYGFKPTDVVVQRDGTLMVSDYADGQRPQRGRGRIYHIAYGGDTPKAPRRTASDPLALLDSESYFERCAAQASIERAGERGLQMLTDSLAKGRIGPRGRLHAIWILVHAQGSEAIGPLLAIAASDPEPSVRAQAVRAIADLADPLLARHRLDAGPGDARLAARLAALDARGDRPVQLEVLVALGRMRWPGLPAWLKDNLTKADAALTHAAMQALRRSGNWPAVLDFIDGPDDDPLRAIAVRACAGQYDELLADRLLELVSRETDPLRLLEYVDLLVRVHKKPPPWVYWGYRPAARPANEVAWSRTEEIAASLRRILLHPDPEVRLATLRWMHREKIPATRASLGPWIQKEKDSGRVATLLEFLREQPVAGIRPDLAALIENPLQASTNRLAALALFIQGLDEENIDELLALSDRLEDGPVLVEALRVVGKYPRLPAVPLLIRKLDSAVPEVRTAAIDALGDRRAAEAGEPLVRLLADLHPQVRRAAAHAAGSLRQRQAIDALLNLASDSDPLVRAASLDSLRLLDEPRAIPLAVAALGNGQTERSALEYLRDLGGPEQADAVADLARRNPSLDVITVAVQALTNWRQRSTTTATQRGELDRAVAEIQGATGSLVRWSVSGPAPNPADVHDLPVEPPDSQTQFAAGIEGRLVLSTLGAEPGNWFHARTEIAVAEQTDVEFFVSSGGGLQLWLNGKSIHGGQQPQPADHGSDGPSATLVQGSNRLVVGGQVGSPESSVEFHLRFRRKSLVADHERLMTAALSQVGNRERGRKILLDVEKSLCLKCHRVNDHGERAGPDLTGVGSRFSRIHIVESILQPSRSVAPSFETVVVVLHSGQVLSGVQAQESETALTLVDDQGQKHQVGKADIEERATSPLSSMPEGLEKRITEEEFVDLVAFLTSLKKTEVAGE